MSKYLIAILLACSFLSGCATVPTYNYKPVTMEISNPPLGTISTAQVGDTMLQQGKYSEHDALYLRQDTPMYNYKFTRGYYLKKGEDENSEFYYPSGGPDSGQVIQSALSSDAFQVICLDKKSGRLFWVTTLNSLEIPVNKADYEKKKYSVASSDSFQQALIYSGKVGNIVKVGYREFSNDLARPAFNNDVEYDLSESKIIGYKGARIEIIQATNEYIKYKVIQNFNKAEI